MKIIFKTAILMAALGLSACDKPEDAKPATPAAPAATAPAATAANTPTNAVGAQGKGSDTVAIADSDLVTPADYESAEETAITPKNYKTEIASLEAEINKE
jgi:hypothetical protein